MIFENNITINSPVCDKVASYNNQILPTSNVVGRRHCPNCSEAIKEERQTENNAIEPNQVSDPERPVSIRSVHELFKLWPKSLD